MSYSKKQKTCSFKGCKNLVGRNKKTGKYFDMCNLHFKKEEHPKSNQKKIEVKKVEEKKKEIYENIYDPNGKLVINVSGAYFINHPKKIRYIRIETFPRIEKNPDFSIVIKSKGRKVLTLPFNNLEEQSKAYSELISVIK
jgi:hypothetical protein